MAWVYLPASVRSSLDFDSQSQTIEQWDTSNKTLSASRSSRSASRKAILTMPLFGIRLKPSTAARGAALWISSLRDSHASPSHQQAVDWANTIRATCGRTQSEPFAKWDRLSYSWKTYPGSDAIRISKRYGETWPRTATTDRGVAYVHRTWAPLTIATDFGKLPTPVSPKSGTNANPQKKEKRKYRPSIYSLARAGLLPGSEHGGPVNPQFLEWMLGLPIGWTSVVQPLPIQSYQQWFRTFSGV